MAPTRALSTPNSLKLFFVQNPKTLVDHEIGVFLTDLHHILHARSCNHFQSFPHTHKPTRPLKWSKIFNLLFEYLQLLLFRLLLEPIWAMVHVPVQGPWGSLDWRALLTDASAHPAPLYGGTTHEGMLRAARCTLDRSLPLMKQEPLHVTYMWRDLHVYVYIFLYIYIKI